jgi:hypothetical protein
MLACAVLGCDADLEVACESARSAESCQRRAGCVADWEGTCWQLCELEPCPEDRECMPTAQYKSPTDVTDMNVIRDACLPPEAE